MTESGEWKGLAVKVAAGVFALVLAGFAVYKMRSLTETTDEEQKGSASDNPKDVQIIMKQFKAGHPDQKNITEFYDKMDHETYDEFNNYVNFTDPDNVS